MASPAMVKKLTIFYIWIQGFPEVPEITINIPLNNTYYNSHLFAHFDVYCAW